jgi:hypothetical protein
MKKGGFGEGSNGITSNPNFMKIRPPILELYSYGRWRHHIMTEDRGL